MDITWLGSGTFLLKGSDLTVVTDPLDGNGKLRTGLPSADVATLSRGLLDQPLPEIKVKRKVVKSPGEFEIAGAFLYGTRTYRDGKHGAERGQNLVFRYILDNIRICHLGEIGHAPTTEQASVIGDVDVLLVPIGKDTLLSELAAEAVSELEPKVVVPFAGPSADDRKALEKFIKDLGLPQAGPMPKLTVTRQSLQEPQRLVLLEQGKLGD